jgi:uncharacterized protein YbgA (DUF1722 family)
MAGAHRESDAPALSHQEQPIQEAPGLTRMKRFFAGEWSVADLVRFHTREKLLLLAHGREAYDRLGRLVAAAGQKPRDELAHEYQAVFSSALEKKPTAGQQVNVLQHILGHFKKRLRPAERAEIRAAIESYRLGTVALDVPIGLFREQVRRHQVAYLGEQHYLAPS